jgi:lathosterol oxidase
MIQGIAFSTICPALSLVLVRNNLSQGYCGVEQHGWTWLAISFFIVWFCTDLYEWAYHYSGHYFVSMWKLHKGHHQFYNPTPFAVVADDPIDQFFRAGPLLLFPLLFPVNMDLIFTMFFLMFYFHGLWQHSGYEIPFVDGHSKYILTSYHHYLHHAKSTVNKPFYNGQLLQIWDNLFQSKYEGECLCSKCARNQGLRTKSKWEKVEIPDYSVLMHPSSWF